MTLQTLADVRAVMSRKRVTVRGLARELAMSESRLSTLLNADDLVEPSKSGAARLEAAIAAVAEKAEALA